MQIALMWANQMARPTSYTKMDVKKNLLETYNTYKLNKIQLTKIYLRPNLTRQNSIVPMLSRVASRLMGTPGSVCFSKTYSFAELKKKKDIKELRITQHISK